MVSVNGNGNVNNNLFTRPSITPKETIKQDVPIGKAPETKELGRDLLNPILPTFVETARIPKADEVQLQEMYAMAGIKNPKMPTVAQYKSVENHVGNVTRFMDELTTTNNAKDLFSSPEFGTLDKLFGIA